MPLQTTGAISIGNVQTEFGGSNPISFSEYYAGGLYVSSGTTGINGAIPSSGSPINLSKFYGSFLQKYFANLLVENPTIQGQGEINVEISDITSTSDSSNYIVSGVVYNTGGFNVGFIFCFNLLNGDVWRSNTYFSTNISYPFHFSCVDIDSSGNIYAFAQLDSYSNNTQPLKSILFNRFYSNGSLRNRSIFNFNFSAYTTFVSPDEPKTYWTAYDVTAKKTLSDGTSYFGGSNYIAKINSDGTLIWSKGISPLGYFDIQLCILRSICVDSSGNVYTLFHLPVITRPVLIFVKFSSSGLLSSLRTIDFSNHSFGVRLDSPVLSGYQTYNYPSSYRKSYAGDMMTIDSSGNLFFICSDNGTNPSTYDDIFITKLNSSGDVVSTRKIVSSSSYLYPQSICCDSSGNVYTLFSIPGQWPGYYSSTLFVLYKYNNNLVLQWTRLIFINGDGQSYTFNAASLYVDKKDVPYITFNVKSGFGGYSLDQRYSPPTSYSIYSSGSTILRLDPSGPTTGEYSIVVNGQSVKLVIINNSGTDSSATNITATNNPSSYDIVSDGSLSPTTSFGIAAFLTSTVQNNYVNINKYPVTF